MRCTGRMSIPRTWIHSLSARLAQSIEHETLNLRVVGSSPTLGDFLNLMIGMPNIWGIFFHLYLLTSWNPFGEMMKPKRLSEILYKTTKKPVLVTTLNLFFIFIDSQVFSQVLQRQQLEDRFPWFPQLPLWRSGLARWTSNSKVAGSNPVRGGCQFFELKLGSQTSIDYSLTSGIHMIQYIFLWGAVVRPS